MRLWKKIKEDSIASGLVVEEIFENFVVKPSEDASVSNIISANKFLNEVQGEFIVFALFSYRISLR